MTAEVLASLSAQGELSQDEIAGSARLAGVELAPGWQRVPRRAGDQRVTVLLPGESSTTLRIDLERSGHCRMALGLFAPAHRAPAAIQVRLSTQQTWRQVRPMYLLNDDVDALQHVELGDFDLPVRAFLECRGVPGSRGGLAYVLCPRASAVVSSGVDTHEAGVVMDTAMSLSAFRMDEPSDLHAILQPYVESGIKHVFWGTAVGTYRPLYRSKTLGWHGCEQESSVGAHRAAAAEVMRRLMACGTDPLQLATAFCRDHGLKLWVNDRINKNHEHDFGDDYAGGRYLLSHTSKRVRTMDGSPHPQATLSFADAQVRAMKVRLLVEQASYEPHGIYLDFLRMPAIVGWEEPVLEAFRSTTGIAPHAAPRSEWFVPWVEHLCGYVTQFLRELRDALAPLEQARGQAIPIMAQVPGGWRFSDGMPEAKFFGLDVVQWAREGLVQYIAPAEWSALMWEVQSFDRWAMLLRGTSCRLWGAMGSQFREGCASLRERQEHQTQPADLDPWRLMRAAGEYVQQGAVGVYVWEAHDLPSALPRWEVVRSIGDAARVQAAPSPPIGPFDARRRVRQVALQ